MLSRLPSQHLPGSLHRAVRMIFSKASLMNSPLWGGGGEQFILGSPRSYPASPRLTSYHTPHLVSSYSGLGRCCSTHLEISCFPSSSG